MSTYELFVFFSHPDFTVGSGILTCASHRISRLTRVADFTAGREFWVIFSHPAPKNFLLHDCIIYLTLWDCNIKLKICWDMTEGENWLLNISDTETASSPWNTKDSCRCFCIRYVYSQLLPSCIFLSFIFHFILQWCPPGRAPTGIPSFTRGFAATSDKVR